MKVVLVCGRLTVTTSNAYARLSWRQPKYELYVESSNLLNTSYRDHGLVEQPGRWLIAGVKVSI